MSIAPIPEHPPCGACAKLRGGGRCGETNAYVALGSGRHCPLYQAVSTAEVDGQSEPDASIDAAFDAVAVLARAYRSAVGPLRLARDLGLAPGVIADLEAEAASTRATIIHEVAEYLPVLSRAVAVQDDHD